MVSEKVRIDLDQHGQVSGILASPDRPSQAGRTGLIIAAGKYMGGRVASQMIVDGWIRPGLFSSATPCLPRAREIICGMTTATGSNSPCYSLREASKAKSYETSTPGGEMSTAFSS